MKQSIASTLLEQRGKKIAEEFKKFASGQIEQIEQLNILIVGAGRSGIDAARLALDHGQRVVIFDGKEDLDISSVKKKIGTDDIAFILGKVKDCDLADVDLCVTSPGVAIYSDVLTAVAKMGIPIMGEVEFASLFDLGSLYAITGTNGKTTTTSLVYEIAKASNDNTLLVGNIEIPYSGKVSESVEGGLTVAEISSFQLETMISFHPHVSSILNITPDHLDRHGSMQNYADLKASITKNQSEDDFVILNYEDERLREYAPSFKPKVVFFSSARELQEGLFLKNSRIVLRFNNEEIDFFGTDELNLVGVHNFENVMAAVGMTYFGGVDIDTICSACKRFTAVEHRIEFVEEIDGVKYYNDSKGTNTDAAIKAIDAMPSKTVLIAGGYDKHADFHDWVSHLPGKCKRLLLIGATAKQIAETCKEMGFEDFEFLGSLEEAVQRAAQFAENGENVLLSPACASWDMFKSYQQRGQIFKDCVRAMK